MAIPEQIRGLAERILDEYCSTPIPEHARGKVRYGYFIRGQSITLFEQHPHFKDKAKWTTSPVARMRFNNSTSRWTLYWRDRNAKWHISEQITHTPHISRLVEVIEEDATGIFWG